MIILPDGKLVASLSSDENKIINENYYDEQAEDCFFQIYREVDSVLRVEEK